MRHAHHGDALLGHLDHHIEHFFDHLGVQRRGRLVEQHDFRRQAQSAGNGHPLLLAAAQLQRVFERLLGNAHAAQLLHGFFFGFFFGHAAHPHRRERQVFQHGEVREQIELLKHHADFFAYIVNRFEVVANLHAIDH